MALTIKHLNSDASFLLSFEPISPDPSGLPSKPFTILLDPWITGPSKIFHSKISISTHKTPACILSLAELPETPDLVIISQHKSDHCNEATLRQLPASGTKTLILAEPASAKLIKSWKYFDREKIRTIEKWEDPRLTGKSTAVRVPVPAMIPGGQQGEVTVAWIPQKRDLAGLHAAIGITYRPPPPNYGWGHAAPRSSAMTMLPTPPATPSSTTQPTVSNTSLMNFTAADTLRLPPSPPVSPHSLRSVQSAFTLLGSPVRATHAIHRPACPLSSAYSSRPISLIFSPHGISYPHLAPYATSHLVSEAALPLTALLHCMDSISNPWWLGGNICHGAPTGADIATRLCPRVWISAHDGEKEVRGLATGMLRTRRYKREEVEEVISPSRPEFEKGQCKVNSGGSGIEIARLKSGEEIIVSGDGMLWMETDVLIGGNIPGMKSLGELLPLTVDVNVPQFRLGY